MSTTSSRSDSEAVQGPQAPKARIGVIADLHGYLDPRVPRIFAGLDHIVVAGDVGDPAILSTLREIAPVTAVNGPSDGPQLSKDLPREMTGEVAGVRFAVGHSAGRLLKHLSTRRAPAGAEGRTHDLVISAGTHEPAVVWIGGTLFLNPGTASSPERDDADPTIAIVEQRVAGLTVRFVPLRRRPAAKRVVRRVMGFRWGIVPTIIEREVGAPRKRRGAR